MTMAFDSQSFVSGPVPNSGTKETVVGRFLYIQCQVKCWDRLACHPEKLFKSSTEGVGFPDWIRWGFIRWELLQSSSDDITPIEHWDLERKKNWRRGTTTLVNKILIRLTMPQNYYYCVNVFTQPSLTMPVCTPHFPGLTYLSLIFHLLIRLL